MFHRITTTLLMILGLCSCAQTSHYPRSQYYNVTPCAEIKRQLNQGYAHASQLNNLTYNAAYRAKLLREYHQYDCKLRADDHMAKRPLTPHKPIHAHSAQYDNQK